MCWRSQDGTGDGHGLCGGGYSSGEAAGDKTGAEVEQEMGHAHQSDASSNKCLSVTLVPGSR